MIIRLNFSKKELQKLKNIFSKSDKLLNYLPSTYSAKFNSANLSIPSSLCISKFFFKDFFSRLKNILNYLKLQPLILFNSKYNLMAQNTINLNKSNYLNGVFRYTLVVFLFKNYLVNSTTSIKLLSDKSLVIQVNLNKIKQVLTFLKNSWFLKFNLLMDL